MLAIGRSIFLYILFTVIQVHSRTKDPVNFLKKLLSRHGRPMVVYLDTQEKEPNNLLNLFTHDNADDEGKSDDGRTGLDNLLLAGPGDDGLLDDDYDEQTMEETARDQAKYLFYNFLRTSADQDPLEDTKQVLRQALRARCKKVTTCVTDCKVKKPSCPMNCQKIFDETNLCEPPKDECKKPRCGRTMPPKW